MHVAAPPAKSRVAPLLAPLSAAALYLVHLLIYVALRLHLHASRLCARAASAAQLPAFAAPPAAPHKPPPCPPPHIALSGALLPPRKRADVDDDDDDDDALAALARHVAAALAAGVRHITLHDAFRDLPVAALLRHVAASLAAASPGARTDARPCVVTELAPDVTRRTQLDLSAPPSPPCERLQTCAADRSDSAAAAGAWGAPVVGAPLRGDASAQLTIVRARAGRAGLARAARKLARERYCNGDGVSDGTGAEFATSAGSAGGGSSGTSSMDGGCGAGARKAGAGTEAGSACDDGADLSVEDVCEWLDRDDAGCMLPSEPDVLISFPVAGLPALPVLRDFPVWQLRLTQLVFAEEPVTALGADEMLGMAASAANAPRRFGR